MHGALLYIEAWGSRLRLRLSRLRYEGSPRRRPVLDTRLPTASDRQLKVRPTNHHLRSRLGRPSVELRKEACGGLGVGERVHFGLSRGDAWPPARRQYCNIDKISRFTRLCVIRRRVCGSFPAWAGAIRRRQRTEVLLWSTAKAITNALLHPPPEHERAFRDFAEFLQGRRPLRRLGGSTGRALPILLRGNSLPDAEPRGRSGERSPLGQLFFRRMIAAAPRPAGRGSPVRARRRRCRLEPELERQSVARTVRFTGNVEPIESLLPSRRD